MAALARNPAHGSSSSSEFGILNRAPISTPLTTMNVCSNIHHKRYLCGSGRAWAAQQRAVRLVTGHPNSVGGPVIPPDDNDAVATRPELVEGPLVPYGSLSRGAYAPDGLQSSAMPVPIHVRDSGTPHSTCHPERSEESVHFARNLDRTRQTVVAQGPVPFDRAQRDNQLGPHERCRIARALRPRLVAFLVSKEIMRGRAQPASAFLQPLDRQR